MSPEPLRMASSFEGQGLSNEVQQPERAWERQNVAMLQTLRQELLIQLDVTLGLDFERELFDGHFAAV